MQSSNEVTPNASNDIGNSMSQLHAAANETRSSVPPESRRPGDPVEFNHAISYVNKIKTRFASQPDIYKTFLEILQTYQREQLRIPEVYAQVTQLFQDAPDLLNDFKQFLPDMIQPRPSEMMPNGNIRLPPVGNFAPPALGSGNLHEPNSSHVLGPQAIPSQMPMEPQPGNRVKTDPDGAFYAQGRDSKYNDIPISGIRGDPQIINKGPMSPNLSSIGLQKVSPPKPSDLTEEISFFEKAKKHIANPQTYKEFVKVLNLFSQRIIDKYMLVEQVEGFLGSDKRLMKWFKDFVRYENRPLNIENIPYKKHLLELSLMRSYGKSYRLLPKSEVYMPCSGRDEMCWEVLNDEWVGHPTWDYGEVGIVGQCKNQYEEIMHRVEEERHEYDYYIEANLRTIQTLETITSRIANMTAEEKSMFKLPPNLGHTSTIYEKVLRRIYGEGRYHEVVDALRERPAISVPIVLRRLKQKDEEWKRAHREWNKVWRDTEQKVYLKSLDHQGLIFKQTDKKYLTTRQLVSEIMTTKKKQSNKWLNILTPIPQEQLVYQADDESVIMDVVRLVLCCLKNSTSYSNDQEQMKQTFKTFVRLFYFLPDDLELESAKLPAEDTDMETGLDSSIGEKRKLSTSDTLDDVLKKSKHPKIGNVQEEDRECNDDSEDIKKAGKLWLNHTNTNTSRNPSEENSRHKFNLFANTPVYVVVRLLHILYERLKEVKGFEKEVSEEIKNGTKVPFALNLKLYDQQVDENSLIFKGEDCYEQALKLAESLIEGNLNHQWYEEAIRHAYQNRAYRLYTLDKVVNAIVKHLNAIVSDAKSSDVLVLFEQDRRKAVSNSKEQLLYRMKVKTVLDVDETMFRIEWNTQQKQVHFQLDDEPDLSPKQSQNQEDAWNYYLTSYLTVMPTEGVPVDNVHMPFIHRNLPDDVLNDDFVSTITQGLVAKVCPSTYRLFFEPSSEDFFSRHAGSSPSTIDTKIVKDKRQGRWHRFLNGPHGWKTDLDEGSLVEAQGKFDAWKTDGPDAMTAWQPPVAKVQDSPGKDDTPAENTKKPDPEEVIKGPFEGPSKPEITSAPAETEKEQSLQLESAGDQEPQLKELPKVDGTKEDTKLNEVNTSELPSQVPKENTTSSGSEHNNPTSSQAKQNQDVEMSG